MLPYSLCLHSRNFNPILLGFKAQSSYTLRNCFLKYRETGKTFWILVHIPTWTVSLSQLFEVFNSL